MAVAPPDFRRCSLEEWEKLKYLVLHGMVFEVQEWIAEGKPTLRPAGCKRSVLQLALQRRNHSMVRVLWESGWQDQTEAGKVRMWTSDPLFLRYFIERDAPFDGMTGYELCKTNDVDLIREGMKRGIEIVESGGWAKAMVETRGGPLIRFYVAEKDRLPGLRRQAANALGDAIAESRIRAVALLRWAGVDPFERIPDEDQAGLPPSAWTHYPASMLFCCEKPVEAIAAMNLKPTPDQWFDLLESSPPLVAALDAIIQLRSDTADLVKERPDSSAKALLHMLHALCWECTAIVGPLKTERIEELAAGCRHFIQLGAPISFGDPRSVNDLRRRIYPCGSFLPLMKIFEFAWDSGSERSREGVRELVRTPRMKELVREHAPKLAVKLRMTEEYQPLFNPPWLSKPKQGKRNDSRRRMPG